MKLSRILTTTIVILIGVSGCGTSKNHLLKIDESQVQLRSIQTRAFDTTEKNQMLRTIITTLQDFDYVLDKADATLGMISATKLDKHQYRITVTVRPRGETQLLVRANVQYKKKAVKDPIVYQNFFTLKCAPLFDPV